MKEVGGLHGSCATKNRGGVADGNTSFEGNMVFR